jgi:hypothetical protein
MTPTEADRAALARLLGVGDPDPRMYLADELLPGVAECPHPMTGSGESVLDYDAAASPLGVAVIEEWRSHPYYHHTFVPVIETGGHPYCQCGNNEWHDLHIMCAGIRLSPPDATDVIEISYNEVALNGPTEKVDITRLVEAWAPNGTVYGMPADQWASYGKEPKP